MSLEQAEAVQRRVLRRELHSSRAGAAITVAVILILLLAALGALCVLLALRSPLVSGVPDGLRAALAQLAGSAPPASVLAGGVLAAILGILLVLIGATPGRRRRRALPSERAAVVADDAVIANALAAEAASVAGVERGQVRVIVDRRRATARIVPTSGSDLDTDAVREALGRNAPAYGLARPARVVVADEGRVGS